MEDNFTETAFYSLYGRGTLEFTMIVTSLTRLAQVPDSPNLRMEEKRRSQIPIPSKRIVTLDWC